MTDLELIEIARQSAKNAYTPYSHFCVGAALLASDGTVYTGCNIENSSFGPTICAERTAFFKAVSEGVREFSAIAIVGGREGDFSNYAPPCGVCRQVMREFCSSDFRVILGKNDDEFLALTLEEILPYSFGPEHI